MSQRLPLYYELFFGLAENQKIEQGLQYVTNSPESHCSPLMREMALAVLEEMEYFRELKNHPLSLNIYRPRKNHENPSVIMTDRIAYDPLLQELAKAVLDEIEYNRGYRKVSRIRIILLVSY